MCAFVTRLVLVCCLQVLCRVGSEEFSASGKRIISAGWTALVSGSALSDTILPEFAKVGSRVCPRCRHRH